jgi:redox-regulated HSP33 family molecular chaperone
VVADARREQAAAQAAAQEAQSAQQLAESSRAVLSELERALDTREAKLQDSWKALKAQLAGSGSGSAVVLHSDQRLQVRIFGGMLFGT